MNTAEKTRETYLRRMAARQGWRLEKSKRRDHRAKDYALWRLVDPQGKPLIEGDPPWDYCMTLADVEDYLTGGRR